MNCFLSSLVNVCNPKAHITILVAFDVLYFVYYNFTIFATYISRDFFNCLTFEIFLQIFIFYFFFRLHTRTTLFPPAMDHQLTR